MLVWMPWVSVQGVEGPQKWFARQGATVPRILGLRGAVVVQLRQVEAVGLVDVGPLITIG